MTNTNKKDKHTPWLFVIFPAITMLLGWGLRGYIGGGPFGAMIPGAMVAISISILLELPPAVSSVFVLFGVVGIGLGGEMTYGQTIGFLRNPDTMWWGALGLTVKGGVWGFLGGIILAVGLIYNRLSKKTIIIYVKNIMRYYYRMDSTDDMQLGMGSTFDLNNLINTVTIDGCVYANIFNIAVMPMSM